MLASTSALRHTKDQVKVQPGPTPPLATLMSALPPTHATLMPIALTTMTVRKHASATLASTATDTSVLWTRVLLAHVKPTHLAPTLVTSTRARAILAFTSDLLLMKDPAKDQHGLTPMRATSMFALLPTHATLMLTARIMLTVLRLACACLVSTVMAWNASSTHAL